MYIKTIIKKLLLRDNSSGELNELTKKGLKVGKNFNMLHGVIIDYSHTWHIEMGDDVTLAPRVHILAHDASTKKRLGYTRIGKVKIGDRVFIGAGSIVLPGVTIGSDVVVGAGSVVIRDIADGQLVAGNPAKIICTSDEYFLRKRSEMESSPCFGEEYTIGNNISNDMKDEMNLKMKNKIGYVV